MSPFTHQIELWTMHAIVALSDVDTWMNRLLISCCHKSSDQSVLGAYRGPCSPQLTIFFFPGGVSCPRTSSVVGDGLEAP